MIVTRLGSSRSRRRAGRSMAAEGGASNDDASTIIGAMCITSWNVRAPLGLALIAFALAGSCAGDGTATGPAVERAPAAGGHGDQAPRTEAEPMALVLGHDPALGEAVAAVRAQGGRVLVVFDEGAAIVRLNRDRLGELGQRRPELVVTTDPVVDDDERALAPRAVAFWNRRLGYNEPGPVTAAVAPNSPPPGDARPRPPAVASTAQLTAAQDEAAQGAIRELFACLVVPDRAARGRCLAPLFEPQALEAHQPLLDHEAAVALERGFDPTAMSAAPQAFDGVRARYELRRDGAVLPTGTVDLTLRSDRWTIDYIAP
jgi:hypothetical protein